MDNGVKLITNGTSNHMMVVDTVQSFGINGKEAERIQMKYQLPVINKLFRTIPILL